MSRITMLTAIPTNLVMELQHKRRLEEYNTIPQLCPEALSVIKEFMTDNVGYAKLPIACLTEPNAKLGIAAEVDGQEFSAVIPANYKESILFQLEMPDDMVVSITYSDLINLSTAMREAKDPDLQELLREQLWDKLYVGVPDTAEDGEALVSFIPFLDYDKCKFCAKFDSDFGTGSMSATGSSVRLKELTSFIVKS